MKYKACIFDLDGTTADSVEAIAHSANESLIEVGLEARPVECYKMYAGDGQQELLKRALKDAGDTEFKHLEEVTKRYVAKFVDGCVYNVKSFPGMPETLERLKASGVKLAVLSNKKHVNTIRVVETIYGDKLFDMVLGQQDSYPRKPEPDGAFIVAKELGVEPKDCLYIGDTDVDMQTGNSAGMDTVGVTWGFRYREELIANMATYIIDRPEEILDLV